MPNQVEVTYSHTPGELMDNILDRLGAGAGHVEEAQDRTEQRKITTLEGLFFYEWWAFPSEEFFNDLNSNSRYPRNIGKGSRPEYDEQPTKDKEIISTDARPPGSMVGVNLGVRKLVPLDTIEDDEIDNVDLGKYPVIALGAARATVEQINAIRAGTLDIRTCDVQNLTWKWHRGDGKLAGITTGIAHVRAVGIDKVPAKLNISVNTKHDTLHVTDVRDILEPTHKYGIKGAIITMFIDGTPKNTLLTDENGFVTFKDIPLGRPIVFTSEKASGYLDNKTGHIYPQKPFVFDVGHKREEFILPLVKKELKKKTPTKKDYNPDKIVNVGNRAITLDAKTRIWWDDHKTEFEAWLVHLNEHINTNNPDKKRILENIFGLVDAIVKIFNSGEHKAWDAFDREKMMRLSLIFAKKPEYLAKINAQSNEEKSKWRREDLALVSKYYDELVSDSN